VIWGKYDTIVLGVRAYAVRPDLIAGNARLLQSVEKGGVVIVQYNTPECDHNYGPYPYVVSGDPEEVTDEKSTVKILEPANPVFNWPNKITESDFDGWIEERGSKFLQTWDPKYSALESPVERLRCFRREPPCKRMPRRHHGQHLYAAGPHLLYLSRSERRA
jgi:hypothetical protein